MSWFSKFFKRHDYQDEFEHAEVPFSTITRWAIYDLSVEEPNEVSVMLGLTPVSDEGHQKEEDDSLMRLSELDALLPFIDIVSELSAKIVSSIQVRDMVKEGTLEKHGITEEELTQMAELYKAVGFSALVTAFSSGIELGILHTHDLKMSSFYKEEEDE